MVGQVATPVVPRGIPAPTLVNVRQATINVKETRSCTCCVPHEGSTVPCGLPVQCLGDGKLYWARKEKAFKEKLCRRARPSIHPKEVNARPSYGLTGMIKSCSRTRPLLWRPIRGVCE